MTTSLLDIKNTYAQELGYKSWSEIMFFNNRNPIAVENHMNEICIIAQKAALEKATENVTMKMKDNISELSMMDDWSEIDRKSITNPENLIR